MFDDELILDLENLGCELVLRAAVRRHERKESNCRARCPAGGLAFHRQSEQQPLDGVTWAERGGYLRGAPSVDVKVDDGEYPSA
jgi:hypothetical protein